MHVIKFFTVLLLLASAVSYGQKSIYPKDTIYIRYENSAENKKWFGTYGYGNNKKEGILFNIRDKNNEAMSLFFHRKNKADTLCVKHLEDYKFSDVKEIREKRHKWIFKNKRPPADRNGLFQTYLVEIISKDYFVIYPVIWRNEGVID